MAGWEASLRAMPIGRSMASEQAFQSAVALPSADAAGAGRGGGVLGAALQTGLAFADKAGVGTTVRAAGSAALTAGSALAQSSSCCRRGARRR